jgi:hypothetical protein
LAGVRTRTIHIVKRIEKYLSRQSRPRVNSLGGADWPLLYIYISFTFVFILLRFVLKCTVLSFAVCEKYGGLFSSFISHWSEIDMRFLIFDSVIDEIREQTRVKRWDNIFEDQKYGRYNN